jgi:hypothetical protein
MFKIVYDFLKALKIEYLEGVIKEIVHAFARTQNIQSGKISQNVLCPTHLGKKGDINA